MRKKLSLLLVALMTVVTGSWAADNLKAAYKLQVGDTFTSGQTVDVKSGDVTVATITYGEAGGNDFAAATGSTAAGYVACTAGNGTDGNKPKGTFYTITPKKDGYLDVGVVLNKDKAFYILEDGVALPEYNGIKVANKLYGSYWFPCKADKAYKIYCAGSKLGFYGFRFAEKIDEIAADNLDFTALDVKTSSSTSDAGDLGIKTIFKDSKSGATLTHIQSNPIQTITRFWTENEKPQLRVYGGTLDFAAPEDKKITKLTITYTQWAEDGVTANLGELQNDEENKKVEWTGQASNVVLTVTKQIRLNSIEATVIEPGAEPYAVLADGVLTFKLDKNKPDENAWFCSDTEETNPEWNNGYYTKVVFDDTFKDARPKSCYKWFAKSSLSAIVGIGNLNTSEVTTMYGMFQGASNLEIVDVTGFDTKNVTDMGNMFINCNKLAEIDVTKFNTENVTNMGYMFGYCNQLLKLDVSKFDTKNVEKMDGMFAGCSGLTKLDVSNFNTEKVTDINCMFINCSKLEALDLKNFNTEKVTRMFSLFENCAALTSVDVSSFNTSAVAANTWEGFRAMFFNCAALKSLNLSSFDTKTIRTMSQMFYKCGELTELDLSNFNTQNVRNMSEMFYGCAKLAKLNIDNFDTQNVSNYVSMFDGCAELAALNLMKFDSRNNGYNMNNMFNGCAKLAKIEATDYFVNYNYNNMFTGCVKLPEFDETIVSGQAAINKYCKIQTVVNDPRTGNMLTIAAGEYKTLFVDQKLKVYGDVGKLYTVKSVTDTEVVLSDAIKVAAAKTPLIIFNDSEEDAKIMLLAAAEDEAADKVTKYPGFQGTLEWENLPGSGDDLDYYMCNGEEFVKVINEGWINPYTCWLEVEKTQAAAAPARRSIVTGGNTTGINVANAANLKSAEIFDLQGRKVSKAQKGLYIINGKKVVVK